MLSAIREAVYIGEQAGTPVQISHFKISNKRHWGASDKSIELVEEYRRKGVDVGRRSVPLRSFEHRREHNPSDLGFGRRAGGDSSPPA